MKNKNNRHNEESVLAVEAAYDRAWLEGNVEGIIACLTKDAVLISPQGEAACGHREIRKLIGEFLSGPARGSIHTGNIIRVKFVTEDVAVVDGEAFIKGMEFTGSPVLAHHRFTDILIRDRDIWFISQIRAYANY